MSGIKEVIVETRARLHLGFLDMNFGLGRRFGSLGLTIDKPVTRLRLTSEPGGGGIVSEKASSILQALQSLYPGRAAPFLHIEKTIPSHAGLGSGTQLALAIGAAFSAYHGHALNPRALAASLDRGARSGIGIGAFERGGFLVDGGRGSSGNPAPIVSSMPFPEHWRVLLVFDGLLAGVHGDEERSAFTSMQPAPKEMADDFCRLTLLKILPALAEREFQPFAEGIRAIQDGIGALFAPYQGGTGFRSPRVREVLAWLDTRGINGSGQTSWGPTGFAFLAPEIIPGGNCEAFLEEIRNEFAHESALRFDLVKGFNEGAAVTARPWD